MKSLNFSQNLKSWSIELLNEYEIGEKSKNVNTAIVSVTLRSVTAAQIGQVKRGVIAVPTAGGAVVVIYNLPGVNNVRLNPDAMKGIFEGKITRIRSINRGNSKKQVHNLGTVW